MTPSIHIGLTSQHEESRLQCWFDSMLSALKSNPASIDSIRYSIYSAKDAWSALSAGELGAILIPLAEAPWHLGENLQYFCVSPLPVRKRIIVCREDVFQENNDGKLVDGTTILVENEITGIQILNLNPTLQFVVGNPHEYSFENSGSQNGPGAVLLFDDQCQNSIDTGRNLKIIQVHPNEFPESAGFGRMVWAAHKESLPLMMQLRSVFHHPDIVPCANIERKIQQNLADQKEWTLRIRCFQDARKFYHIKVMVIHPNSRTRISHTMSQSTHHLLAEKMTAVLLDSITKETTICI